MDLKHMYLITNDNKFILLYIHNTFRFFADLVSASSQVWQFTGTKYVVLLAKDNHLSWNIRAHVIHSI